MNTKKTVLATMIFSLILGLIFGGLIILLSQVLNVSALIKWALIIAGIFTVLGNIPSFVVGIVNMGQLRGLFDLIFSFIGIILGLMMIFKQGTVMTFILAGYLIVFPLLRILLSGKNGWKDQIKKEWFKMLIGALLFFFPGFMAMADTIVKTFVFIIGCIVIFLSLLFFIISFVAYLLPSRRIRVNGESMHIDIEVNAEDISDEE